MKSVFLAAILCISGNLWAANFADYQPASLGSFWTYQSAADSNDTYTVSVFEKFTFGGFGGQPAVKIGAGPDDYNIGYNNGSSITIYAGPMDGITSGVSIGNFTDGVFFNLIEPANFAMLRMYDNLNPALKSVYGVTEPNLVLWVVYDSEYPRNSQNSIVESNLGVTLPNYAVTGLEWYAKGVGEIIDLDVDAATGAIGERYELIVHKIVPEPICTQKPTGDLNNNCNVDLEDLAIFAGQWLSDGRTSATFPDITWVSINDPGVSGHEGFNGQMSKYETTNAQYCQFLNAALDSGDITVSGNNVIGQNGSNSGSDFVGQVYYNLAGPGYTYDGATNGGAARINWTGSSFTVDAGFENHPVTYVSWYSSAAFASYYGWRLPTEWEWQAVADYNGNFNYGCGTTITNSMANYYGSTHPDGTTAVGAFGTYGYGMCDMAGNTREWTDSISGGNRVTCGGSWYYGDDYCTVFGRDSSYPLSTSFRIGFRVCR